jgi:hypothetical protein
MVPFLSNENHPRTRVGKEKESAYLNRHKQQRKSEQDYQPARPSPAGVDKGARVPSPSLLFVAAPIPRDLRGCGG